MAPAPIKLPPGALERVGASIAGHAGLKLPDWVLEARLRERIAALGLATADDYIDIITAPAGGKELDLLVEVLRVGETGFFRHRCHIKALTDVVIPALAERGSGRVKVWSAGCATGEEAYTLALLLGKLLPRSTKVEILATDLSREALEVAARGVYPASALAPIPKAWRDWGFVPIAPQAGQSDRGGTAADSPSSSNQYRVAEQVAELVTFERQNLADQSFPRTVDLIWCRNVLIYFGREARERTIGRLVDSLETGGFLFLGYAESLHGFDGVEAIRTPDAVLYRKADRPGLPTPPRAGQSRPRPEICWPTADAAVTPEEVFIQLRGSYREGSRLVEELSVAISGKFATVVVDLDGADYLGEAAAAVIRRACSTAKAAGTTLQLVAERPGPLRWLRRSGLAGEENR